MTFASDSLLEGLSKREKYLAIEPDGLHWHWMSEDYDEKECIEQSLVNYELWLFDRRLQGQW